MPELLDTYLEGKYEQEMGEEGEGEVKESVDELDGYNGGLEGQNDVDAQLNSPDVDMEITQSVAEGEQLTGQQSSLPRLDGQSVGEGCAINWAAIPARIKRACGDGGGGTNNVAIAMG